MSKYEISDYLWKKLKKISKKDKILFDQIMKKIEDIASGDNVDYYKNLKYDLKSFKRVHVGHFVLIFKMCEEKIYFEDFDHHDTVY